jgi:hypothetical protein
LTDQANLEYYVRIGQGLVPRKVITFIQVVGRCPPLLRATRC